MVKQMAGSEHHSHNPELHDVPSAARNARYGAVLFLIYSLLYGTFVAINAFQPGVMDTIVMAGVNLAIIYGLGLIAAAFVLALVYVWLCRHPAPARSAPRRK
jgi:uncharacterized membrane protein (DUF485 family)